MSRTYFFYSHIILWGDYMYTIYEVQKGDTLASVAQKFNTTLDTLSSLNGIMAGSLLKAGDYLVVPRVKTENPYFREYVIKNGDNIYEIARANGIELNQLLRLNGLNDSDIIYPNQLIMLPRKNVSFYITEDDDTLGDVMRRLNVNANDLVKQNPTIYLTNDQLILYKK